MKNSLITVFAFGGVLAPDGNAMADQSNHDGNHENSLAPGAKN